MDTYTGMHAIHAIHTHTDAYRQYTQYKHIHAIHANTYRCRPCIQYILIHASAIQSNTCNTHKYMLIHTDTPDTYIIQEIHADTNTYM